MSLHVILAAVLSLSPVLDEPTDLRLVARDVEARVVWTVDGAVIGESGDREVLTVQLAPGEHRIVAETDHDGAWRIMARPDAPYGEGAAYVGAWTAASEGVPTPAPASARNVPWTPIALGALALALFVWPRRSEAGK